MKLWTEWALLLRAGVKTDFLLLLGQRVLTTQRQKDTDRRSLKRETEPEEEEENETLQ